MKFFGRVRRVSRTSQSDFSSNPDHDRDTGIFKDSSFTFAIPIGSQQQNVTILGRGLNSWSWSSAF